MMLDRRVLLGILMVVGVVSVVTASIGYSSAVLDRGSNAEVVESEDAYLSLQFELNETSCDLTLTATNRFSVPMDVQVTIERHEAGDRLGIGDSLTTSTGLMPNKNSADVMVSGENGGTAVKISRSYAYACEQPSEGGNGGSA